MPSIVIQPNNSDLIAKRVVRSDTGEVSLGYTYLTAGLTYLGTGTIQYKQRTYLKFTIPSLNGKTVNSAIIFVYVIDVKGTAELASRRKIDIHKITSQWDYSTLAVEPSWDSDILYSQARIDKSVWYNFDVTNSINNNQPYGWLLKVTDDNYTGTTGYTYYDFTPSTSGNEFRPKLIIDYTVKTPTATSPNGEIYNLADTITVSWDKNEVTQTGYVIQWSNNSGASWNEISADTSSNQVQIVGNTFTAGTITWRVKTKDEYNNYSEYSNQLSFTALEKPSVKNLQATSDTGYPIVSWELVAEQTMFQVDVYSGENLLISKIVESALNIYTLEYKLENNTNYDIKVKVKNTALWSDVATINVTTSFTLPPIPMLALEVSQDYGIVVKISNPESGDNDYNNILRRVKDATAWETIKENVVINGQWKDYTVKSDTEYEYQVEAVATSTGTAVSEVSSSRTIIPYSQIADFINETCVELKFNLKKEFSNEYEFNTMFFAGRTLPVFEFGEHNTNKIQIAVTLRNINDVEKLKGMIGKTIVYRDSKCRLIYCVISSAISVADKKNSFDVSFLLTEVDYTSGV